MESIIALSLLLGVAFVMFRNGKQVGSRLGFGAGRRSRRNRSR